MAATITDGGFAAASEGSELASGLLTVGDCYRITARTDGDFQASGSPNDTVGTYFIASDTGIGLLDAGDKVKPVTFDSWTEGNEWAPEAAAGSLTAKANKTATTATDLEQDIGAVAGEEISLTFTVSDRTAGSVTPQIGGADGTARSSDASFTETIYTIADGNLIFQADATFDGSIDTVSATTSGVLRHRAGIRRIRRGN